MGALPLRDAIDARLVGGKAASLARALRAGLPVPDGIALPWRLVEAIVRGDAELGDVGVRAPYAVRSSAIGEDAAAASFAGQHASLLNVSRDGLAGAVGEIWRSAHGAAPAAYRARLGLPAEVRVGVVVQELVDADVAGVLFHPHPVTGADEVVVEAAWGLGEAVAAGLVVPDSVRLSRDGAVLEYRAGVKDVEVRPGGRRAVAAERAGAACLDAVKLAALHRLAVRCVEVYGGGQDVEWAIAGDAVSLLQRREPVRSPP